MHITQVENYFQAKQTNQKIHDQNIQIIYKIQAKRQTCSPEQSDQNILN
jgi:hypothetical protein